MKLYSVYATKCFIDSYSNLNSAYSYSWSPFYRFYSYAMNPILLEFICYFLSAPTDSIEISSRYLTIINDVHFNIISLFRAGVHLKHRPSISYYSELFRNPLLIPSCNFNINSNANEFKGCKSKLHYFNKYTKKKPRIDSYFYQANFYIFLIGSWNLTQLL